MKKCPSNITVNNVPLKTHVGYLQSMEARQTRGEDEILQRKIMRNLPKTTAHNKKPGVNLLHDDNAKHGRTRRMSPAEQFKVYGKDTLLYKSIKHVLTRAGKPMSVSLLQTLVQELPETQKQITPPKFRDLVWALERGGELKARRKLGGAFYPYPPKEVGGASKMPLFVEWSNEEEVLEGLEEARKENVKTNKLAEEAALVEAQPEEPKALPETEEQLAEPLQPHVEASEPASIKPAAGPSLDPETTRKWMADNNIRSFSLKLRLAKK